MNFFKKISSKVLAFLIILYLSFTLTGCPSAPSTKTVEVTEETTEISKLETDTALIEFWDTYLAYVELSENERTLELDQKYNENTNKINAIADEGVGLTTREKDKIGKLAQEALDIIVENNEILDEIEESLIYNLSNLISDLQGNVVKISDPSKKLLAQEIADKLREINNLKIERISLHKKDMEYFRLFFRNDLFVSQGKMTMEELIKSAEEMSEEVIEINERIDKVVKAVQSLIAEVSDLVAKLDSLGLYK